jgi:hypothetical protein
VLRVLRKREQDLVQGIQDVETRWTRTYDACQGILARDNHRILRAQRTRPRRLELYADDPAEKRPASLPMTKVWSVHDHFAGMSGARDGFSKAEGEFPKRRGKRQAVCSQPPPISQDVNRIYKAAVVFQRRELGVKGRLREQLFAIFGYLNGSVRQCSIPCWQILALREP